MDLSRDKFRLKHALLHRSLSGRIDRSSSNLLGMHEGTATQPATKKGEETRDRILAAATDLIHQRGYKATGVAEIVAASGVPKGSFYFYFASKEELGRVLLQRYREKQLSLL